MAGELLQADTFQSVHDSATFLIENGLAQSKALGLAVVGIAGTGAAVVARNHMAKASEGSGNGRVRRVPAGHLGLRERNNNFYKSVPVTDGEGQPTYDDEGQQVFDKQFYQLMLPGFRVSLMPLRKYELHDCRSVSRPITPTKVTGLNKRQYDIEARVDWGFILGFDDNRQRLNYNWSNGDPVSVEQLVVNGIMSGRDGLETSERVSGKVGKYMRKYLTTLEDVGTFDDDAVLDSVREQGHDTWLEMGVEVRGIEITQASPTDVDHVMNDFTDAQLVRFSQALNGVQIKVDRDEDRGLHSVDGEAS